MYYCFLQKSRKIDFSSVVGVFVFVFWVKVGFGRWESFLGNQRKVDLMIDYCFKCWDVLDIYLYDDSYFFFWGYIQNNRFLFFVVDLIFFGQ